MNRSILLGAITLFSLSNFANAAVIFLDESRSVQSSASINTPTLSRSSNFTNRSPGDFSNFNELLDVGFALPEGSANAVSDQVSQINTTSISASGGATSSAEINFTDPSFSSRASANASSDLSIRFQLTTQEVFSLSGVVSLNEIGFSSGNANVSLTNQNRTFELSFGTGFSSGMTPFDLGGTLFPDIYILSATANSRADVFGVDSESAFSDFTVNLQLGQVPIPASAWLFGSGILGLIGIARRKKAT